MASAYIAQGRHYRAAFGRGDGAAGVEVTAGGRIERARHVPLQDDPLTGFLDVWIGYGDRRQERLGIRVEGIVVKLRRACYFHYPTKVHHGDPRAYILHCQEVMGDEHVSETLFLFLQLLEQVDDLSLYRDVEGGDRLVADDQRRITREGPGYGDALALTAGELMGIAVGHAGVEPRHGEELFYSLLALLGVVYEMVHSERLSDDTACAHPGVEGAVRVLEDHRHLAAQVF